MNQNLEQIRAKHALDRAADVKKQNSEGDCLSGYPSLVINNGLLATLAFSLDKEKQHARVANAVAYHLHKLGTVSQTGNGAPSASTLRDALTKADSQTLRRATVEVLAFLAYLKRFAK
ncbi:MAG: type III-B CRISPR module-associated protein Cmr5 [Verrucomicrobiota bacterium]